jgi:SET domain-containing protein
MEFSAMTTTRKPRLSVRNAGEMGRGVFAGQRIRKGTVIEICPVIPLSKADEATAATTIMDRYLFSWGEDKQRACIALGFGCLYNHSSKPNAVGVEVNAQTQIEIVALRDIAKDEQILIDYQWEEDEYHFARDE